VPFLCTRPLLLLCCSAARRYPLFFSSLAEDCVVVNRCWRRFLFSNSSGHILAAAIFACNRRSHLSDFSSHRCAYTLANALTLHAFLTPPPPPPSPFPPPPPRFQIADVVNERRRERESRNKVVLIQGRLQASTVWAHASPTRRA
jgi:hypothetical protein